MIYVDIILPKTCIKIDPDDYKKDGLIYCGKCHTPKQWRGTILGQVRIMPSLCKCAKERMEKEEAERRERERKRRIDDAKNIAFGDGRMKSWTFDNDDGANQDLSRKMRNYVENFKTFSKNGRGLLLYGSTGNGKTYMGCCVANALIEKEYSVLVRNFASISNELFSATDKSEYMSRINSVDLLMLDDLDIERESSYMNEVVCSVIDGRYRANKPIVVTTNLSTAQLKETTSMDKRRVYSRLMDMCVPIHVVGADRRYENARKSFANDMKILNGE